MKNGKLHKSGIIKVLLGLAVAGVLLFASCQDIFDTAGQAQKSGGGYVVVDLGDLARTVRPGIGTDNFGTDNTGTNQLAKVRKIAYTFTGVDASGAPTGIVLPWNEDENTIRSQPFFLPAGAYELKVEVYSNQNYTASGGTTAYRVVARGEYTAANGGKSFTVVDGATISVSVGLNPVNVDAQKGRLILDIELPNTATPVFTLKQYVNGDYEDITDLGSIQNNNLGAGSVANTLKFGTAGGATGNGVELPPGTYRFTARVNTTDGKYGGFTEAVHIVSNIATTIIKKSSNTTTYDAVDLVQVTSSNEAIDILKREIKTWVTSAATSSNGGRSVLAYGDPVVSSDNTTITLNYLGSELANPNSNNVLASQFPLTLQGGWQVIQSDGTSNTNTFSVPNSAYPTTYNLRNISVESDSVNNVYNTTYKLVVNPVAEYWVSNGPNTNPADVGSITEFKDGAGAVVNFPTGTIRRAIGAIGSTNVTVSNAAITQDKADVTLSASGAFTFMALSQVYEFVLYEPAAKQAENALKLLKDSIAPNRTGPTTQAPGLATPWVARPGILAQVGWQEDLTGQQNLTTGSTGGVVLYYVYSRLVDDNVNSSAFDSDKTTEFKINLPSNDSRWNRKSSDWLVTEYDVTNAAVIINRSKFDTKQISFKPVGGAEVVFDVRLQPVAEFYVDFAPETWQKTNPNAPGYGTDPDNDSVTISGGSIAIRDSDSSTNPQPVTFDRTDKSGKRFAIGTPATITLTNVAIMIDDDVVDTYTNAYTLVAAGSGQKRPDSPDFANIVQGTSATTPAAYTINSPTLGSSLTPGNPQPALIGAISREYHIKVYPSIKAQEDEQIAKLRARPETDAEAKLWISNPDSNRRVEPLSHFASTNPNDTPRSNIIYVGTEPVLALPSAPTYPKITGSDGVTNYGWVDIDDDDVTFDISNTIPYAKDVTVQYKSFGGLPHTIYVFRVYAAAQYSLIFEKEPIGLAKASGTVSVGGNSPWLAQQGTAPTYTTDTTIPQLIGLGSGNPAASSAAGTPIVFTSTMGSNVFGYEGTYVGTTSGGAFTPGTAGPTYTGTALTVNNLKSQTYTVRVYPSVTNQKKVVEDGFKAITNINGWGAGISTVKVEVDSAPLTLNLQVVTNDFNFIDATPANIAKLSVPTNWLNQRANSNSFGYAPIDASAVTVPDAATGTRTDTFTFVPLGKGTGDQDLAYVFKMTQVAKYTVRFQPGPNANVVTRGTLSVKTFEVGKNTLVANDKVPSINPSTFPNTIIGGVSSANLTTTISVADANVFQVIGYTIPAGGGSAVPDPVINGGASNADDKKLEIAAANLASKEYIIDVYPSVVDQKTQVVDLLKAVRTPITSTVNNVADGWFVLPAYADNVPAAARTIFRGTEITPLASGVASNMQYILGTAAIGGALTTNVPTVKVPEKFLSTKYQATPYNLTVTNPANQTGTAITAVPFSFRAFGAASPEASIYTFNLVPMVQYSVVYSGTGVEGAITITPDGQAPLPQVFAGSSVKTVYGPVGSTIIKIDADANKFTTVKITNNQTTNEVMQLTSSGTGSITLITDQFNAKSGVYTILVSLGN